MNRRTLLRAEELERRDTPVALGGLPEFATPLAVSGTPNGLVQAHAPGPNGQFITTAAFTLAPFPGFAGVVRAAVGDVNGDGISDYVAVTGPGTATRLAVIDGINQNLILVQPTDPFNDPLFTGGAFVAVGDINGDNNGEIVVSADVGGGPRVVVFTFVGGNLLRRADFFGIDDPNFRGGARVAVGDIDANGFGDVIVAAGFGGGPRVSIYRGEFLAFGGVARLVPDFFAFDGPDSATLRNGVFVASGDINGDVFDDLVFGAGPGGAPRVQVLSGQRLMLNGIEVARANPLSNFFAGDAALRGGVRVATKNVAIGNRTTVVTGSGENEASRVRVFFQNSATQFPDPTVSQTFDPFGLVLANGVFVG